MDSRYIDDSVDLLDLLFTLPFYLKKISEAYTDELETIKFYQYLDEYKEFDQGNEPVFFHQIGISYRAKYEKTGNSQYLQNAIDAYRKALSLTTLAGRQKASLLSLLGNSLRNRFDLMVKLDKI